MSRNQSMREDAVAVIQIYDAKCRRIRTHSSEAKDLDQRLIRAHNSPTDGLAIRERAWTVPAIERDLQNEIARDVPQVQRAIRNFNLRQTCFPEASAAHDAAVSFRKHVDTHRRTA